MTPLHAPDERVHAEVDLDSPVVEHGGGRRGGPLLTGALVVAGLALVGATALRTALTPPPGPPRPAVTATYTLRDVVPAGDGEPAQADLVVTVTNRTDDVRTLDRLRVSGPRTGTGQPADGDPGAFSQTGLEPQGAVRVVLRRDLDCSAAEPPAGEPGVDVVVSVSGVGELTAVPVGRAAEQDGVCQELYAATPSAALPSDRADDGPRLTATARQDGERLRLDLAGLPDGTSVGAVRAGTWTLPVVSSRPGPDGTLRLLLERPTSACDLLRRTGTVPFGLTVTVASFRTQTTGDTTAISAESVDRPVAVGPPLARWLTAGTRACD